ncbi:MAG TPA: glycosyltransferase [Gemmatimonadales bacterium]|nr:glycosyltransferase [Gemmatimonadales bacterium]
MSTRPTQANVRSVLVLNYEYPPVGGGAGVATAALAAALAGRGIRVDVVTAHPGDRSIPPVVAEGRGLTVHRVRSRRTAVHEATMLDAASYLAAALPCVRRLRRGVTYDVAHFFFSLPTGMLLPLFRGGEATIVSLRGSDVPGYDPSNRGLQRAHRLLRPVTRAIWRRADRVVAVCESLGRLALRTDPWLRYTVIPNGVDIDCFRPAAAAAAAAGACAGSPIRCIAVARLVERKGLDDLLLAVARLEHGRYRLEIVGSGPAEPALRDLAGRLGLGDMVRFTGAVGRAAVGERLRDADLFTLPSREEAFGNVFAEAMAAGLPVVGTAVGGIPEVVHEGEHGFLVPPRDPGALAAAIRRLGEQPALRAAISTRNRARAVSHFSWAAVAEKYLAVYAAARRVTKAERSSGSEPAVHNLAAVDGPPAAGPLVTQR